MRLFPVPALLKFLHALNAILLTLSVHALYLTSRRALGATHCRAVYQLRQRCIRA